MYSTSGLNHSKDERIAQILVFESYRIYVSNNPHPNTLVHKFCCKAEFENRNAGKLSGKTFFYVQNRSWLSTLCYFAVCLGDWETLRQVYGPRFRNRYRPPFFLPQIFGGRFKFWCLDLSLRNPSKRMGLMSVRDMDLTLRLTATQCKTLQHTSTQVLHNCSTLHVFKTWRAWAFCP